MLDVRGDLGSACDLDSAFELRESGACSCETGSGSNGSAHQGSVFTADACELHRPAIRRQIASSSFTRLIPRPQLCELTARCFDVRELASKERAFVAQRE
jgi:hypothetical protein